MLDKAQARNRVILALISGFVVRVACKSFFGRFVLNELSKNGRFVSNSAKIWICGLYTYPSVFRQDGHFYFVRLAVHEFGHIRKADDIGILHGTCHGKAV